MGGTNDNIDNMGNTNGNGEVGGNDNRYDSVTGIGQALPQQSAPVDNNQDSNLVSTKKSNVEQFLTFKVGSENQNQEVSSIKATKDSKKSEVEIIGLITGRNSAIKAILTVIVVSFMTGVIQFCLLPNDIPNGKPFTTIPDEENEDTMTKKLFERTGWWHYPLGCSIVWTPVHAFYLVIMWQQYALRGTNQQYYAFRGTGSSLIFKNILNILINILIMSIGGAFLFCSVLIFLTYFIDPFPGSGFLGSIACSLGIFLSLNWKPEVNKQDLNKAEINKQDPNKAEINKLDPNEAEVDKQDPNKAEINKQDPNKAEINKQDPNKAEISKQDPNRKIDLSKVKNVDGKLVSSLMFFIYSLLLLCGFLFLLRHFIIMINGSGGIISDSGPISGGEQRKTSGGPGVLYQLCVIFLYVILREIVLCVSEGVVATAGHRSTQYYIPSRIILLGQGIVMSIFQIGIVILNGTYQLSENSNYSYGFGYLITPSENSDYSDNLSSFGLILVWSFIESIRTIILIARLGEMGKLSYAVLIIEGHLRRVFCNSLFCNSTKENNSLNNSLLIEEISLLYSYSFNESKESTSQTKQKGSTTRGERLTSLINAINTKLGIVKRGTPLDKGFFYNMLIGADYNYYNAKEKIRKKRRQPDAAGSIGQQGMVSVKSKEERTHKIEIDFVSDDHVKTLDSPIAARGVVASGGSPRGFDNDDRNQLPGIEGGHQMILMEGVHCTINPMDAIVDDGIPEEFDLEGNFSIMQREGSHTMMRGQYSGIVSVTDTIQDEKTIGIIEGLHETSSPDNPTDGLISERIFDMNGCNMIEGNHDAGFARALSDAAMRLGPRDAMMITSSSSSSSSNPGTDDLTNFVEDDTNRKDDIKFIEEEEEEFKSVQSIEDVETFASSEISKKVEAAKQEEIGEDNPGEDVKIRSNPGEDLSKNKDRDDGKDKNNSGEDVKIRSNPGEGVSKNKDRDDAKDKNKSVSRKKKCCFCFSEPIELDENVDENASSASLLKASLSKEVAAQAVKEGQHAVIRRQISDESWILDHSDVEPKSCNEPVEDDSVVPVDSAHENADESDNWSNLTEMSSEERSPREMDEFPFPSSQEMLQPPYSIHTREDSSPNLHSVKVVSSKEENFQAGIATKQVSVKIGDDQDLLNGDADFAKARQIATMLGSKEGDHMAEENDAEFYGPYIEGNHNAENIAYGNKDSFRKDSNTSSSDPLEESVSPRSQRTSPRNPDPSSNGSEASQRDEHFSMMSNSPTSRSDMSDVILFFQRENYGVVTDQGMNGDLPPNQEGVHAVQEISLETNSKTKAEETDSAENTKASDSNKTQNRSIELGVRRPTHLLTSTSVGSISKESKSEDVHRLVATVIEDTFHVDAKSSYSFTSEKSGEFEESVGNFKLLAVNKSEPCKIQIEEKLLNNANGHIFYDQGKDPITIGTAKPGKTTRTTSRSTTRDGFSRDVTDDENDCHGIGDHEDQDSGKEYLGNAKFDKLDEGQNFVKNKALSDASVFEEGLSIEDQKMIYMRRKSIQSNITLSEFSSIATSLGFLVVYIAIKKIGSNSNAFGSIMSDYPSSSNENRRYDNNSEMNEGYDWGMPPHSEMKDFVMKTLGLVFCQIVSLFFIKVLMYYYYGFLMDTGRLFRKNGKLLIIQTVWIIHSTIALFLIKSAIDFKMEWNY